MFKILNAITSNLATDQVYFSRPENEVSKYRADKLFMHSTRETIMYIPGCETDHCHFKYIIPLNSSAYFIDSQKCQSEKGEDNGNSWNIFVSDNVCLYCQLH